MKKSLVLAVVAVASIGYAQEGLLLVSNPGLDNDDVTAFELGTPDTGGSAGYFATDGSKAQGCLKFVDPDGDGANTGMAIGIWNKAADTPAEALPGKFTYSFAAKWVPNTGTGTKSAKIYFNCLTIFNGNPFWDWSGMGPDLFTPALSSSWQTYTQTIDDMKGYQLGWPQVPLLSAIEGSAEKGTFSSAVMKLTLEVKNGTLYMDDFSFIDHATNVTYRIGKLVASNGMILQKNTLTFDKNVNYGYTVYDMKGKTVLSRKGFGNKVESVVTGAATGEYLVKVTSDLGTMSGSVLVR